MTRIFLDTNIFVYTYDSEVPDKRDHATELIASLEGPSYMPVTSTQVLQELYNTLTRKIGFTPSNARIELLLLKDMETIVVTPDIILAATELHASASISFWDALIVAAAQSAGCDELWTEDMQTGRMFGTLKVVNPLAGK